MTYKEVTDYLFNKTANFEKQGVSGYKVGLDNMLALDEHYGHPHRQFRTIHVAGTNGKGSVSHSLAAILQECGYKVGLYTSPHLVDFCERIRVNGKPIPHGYVTKFVKNGYDFFEQQKPTFFEITTALAFKYFSEQHVDIAVIEVGLGGRLDSTNIINPILSVITNISSDHTQLLGSTLKEIAWQKAGIMKKGVPCVVGEATTETHAVFDGVAQETGAPLIYAEEPVLIESAEPLPDGKGMHYRTSEGVEFNGELSGQFQKKNTNTILYATLELMRMGCIGNDKSTDLSSLQEVLNRALTNVTRTTGLMARWQTVMESPTVVCDTGHNIGAWEHLSRQLSQVKCHELRIVFGMLGDKDIDHVMAKLPKNARYYWTKGNSHRACSEESLQEMGLKLGLKGDCYPTVKQACRSAIGGARSDDFIFIGGSTYIVADFLKNRQ